MAMTTMMHLYLRSDWVLDSDDGQTGEVRDDDVFLVPVGFMVNVLLVHSGDSCSNNLIFSTMNVQLL